MEADYEIGRTFADELIPYSLEYFLGINPENDDEDFDDVDEDEDDKDGGDETDSDDGKKKKVLISFIRHIFESIPLL